MAAALALAGSRCGGVLAGPRDGALYRLVLYSLAGWVGLHLLLTALGLVRLPWRLPVVLAALAAAAALAWRWLPAPADRTRLPSDLGWGEWLAAAALAVFTVCALSSWITNPDFVYHWGLKGNRFYVAGGVDYGYLGARWNWVVHPDYPNLLPELFAVTALAAGRFDEPAMMLWSAAAFALLLAALREAPRRTGTSRFAAQAALAGGALATAAYGIAGMSAGGADWLIALALAAALPPLLSPVDRHGAAQIGLAAALAAAAKVEGVPLAAALAAVYGARAWAARAPTRRVSRGFGLRAVLALTLPAAAVTLPWLAEVWRHHLFLDYNSGPLTPERLPRVLAAIAASMDQGWSGFAYGLLLLPLLFLDRRLRAFAAVVSLQLLFYLYVFLSVRIDPEPLVRSTVPRLVLHLLPAVLTAAVIALDGPAARGVTGQESPRLPLPLPVPLPLPLPAGTGLGAVSDPEPEPEPDPDPEAEDAGPEADVDRDRDSDPPSAPAPPAADVPDLPSERSERSARPARSAVAGRGAASDPAERSAPAARSAPPAPPEDSERSPAPDSPGGAPPPLRA